MSAPTGHEQYEILLVKAVDGQLNAGEERQLAEHMERCGQCREELADFTAIKETTDAMTERIMQDAIIEPPRESAPARAWIIICSLLVIGGLGLLYGFGALQLLADPSVPLPVKIGTGAAALGVVGLLIYLLRVKLRGAGKDPYREIDQ